MRISIGIFAHDSTRTLPDLVRSLVEQRLLRAPPDRIGGIDVWCVANGCTDGTEAVASAEFARAAEESDQRVRWRVDSTTEPGKSRAWNRFVHCVADPESAYLVFLDADVVLLDSDALGALIAGLETDASAVAASGRPVKDVERRKRRGISHIVSAAASDLSRATRTGAIAGCLYCLRGPYARTLWLPVGLQVEDGFLRAMVVTDQFRRPADRSRVVPVPSAAVQFEAYTRVPEVVRHEIRGMEGSVVNSFLYTVLWAESGARGAGALIREYNERSPAWVAECVEREVRARGWWVVPRDFLTWRLTVLSRVGWARRAVLLPIALLRTVLDWYVAGVVNRRLRRGAWGAW